MAYSHIKILSIMLYSKSRQLNVTQISQVYFFVPDQSDKQAFEMRFCSKIEFLIKLTSQIFIFTDHNS